MHRSLHFCLPADPGQGLPVVLLGQMHVHHGRVHLPDASEAHHREHVACLGRDVRQECMPPNMRRHLLADSGQHRNLLKADVEAKFEALCMAGKIEIELLPNSVGFPVEKDLDRQMHFR